MNRCFLQDKFCCRELYEANRASTRKKHPSGGWEGLILAFIVCVSSVNGGMAPGEMETIFAAEYGIRMCSPFSAGIARRTAIQPKIFFSQPNGEDQSPRSETSATNGTLLRIQICVRHYSVPATSLDVRTLWVVIALRRQEESEEKNILRSLRSNKLFLQLTSPRVGWVG